MDNLDNKELEKIIKLKAKCVLLECKLYETGVFVDARDMEIYVDSSLFIRIAEIFNANTLVYDPTWHKNDERYGMEYFYITLFNKKFKVFSLWEKGK